MRILRGILFIFTTILACPLIAHPNDCPFQVQSRPELGDMGVLFEEELKTTLHEIISEYGVCPAGLIDHVIKYKTYEVPQVVWNWKGGWKKIESEERMAIVPTLFDQNGDESKSLLFNFSPIAYDEIAVSSYTIEKPFIRLWLEKSYFTVEQLEDLYFVKNGGFTLANDYKDTRFSWVPKTTLEQYFDRLSLNEISSFLIRKQSESPLHSTEFRYYGKSFGCLPHLLRKKTKIQLSIALTAMIIELNKIKKPFLDLFPQAIHSIDFGYEGCSFLGSKSIGLFTFMTRNLFICLEPDAIDYDGVFTHEAGHAIDFHLPIEPRREYRRLSWKRPFLLSWWKKRKDAIFTSEYAKTNTYEDFAEAFTYFNLYPESMKKHYPERSEYFLKLISTLAK